MQEDYILLKFSTDNAISFNIGDNIPDGFELTESFKPALNTKTNGYDYELRFDRYYFKWKNKKFFYAPEFGARPLKRFIQKTIETQIAEQIIEQKVDPKIPYTLDIRDNVVQLNPFA